MNKTMLASCYKFCKYSRIFQRLYLNLPDYIFSTFKRAKHFQSTWWFCLYFLLNPSPHSQATSIIKRLLLCAPISFSLMLSWHCWQLTSSSEHRSKWSFAWFSVIFDTHHLQWPWTIPSAAFARRFGQMVVTGWQQILHLPDCPWFLLLSIFTQKAQKECHIVWPVWRLE